MTIKGESFDLIREKRELDVILSNITGILLSDEVVREKPAVIEKVKETLPGADGHEPFSLIREKEELDAFLSGITKSRLPDGVVGEAVSETMDESSKEKQPVEVHKVIEASVSDDDVSTHSEPECKDSLDKAQGVIDTTQKEGPKEVAKAEEKQTILRDEKLTKKETGVAEIKDREPHTEDRRTKEKKASVEEHKKGLWGARIRMIGLFTVFIVITQVYFWLNPDAGHHTIEWMRTHITFVDQLLKEEKNDKNIIINKIELINVRQRIVQNESLGTLLIIEGAAVNQADFSVTRVKVLGELSDSHGRLLIARTSYCGNILSDEALGRLQEEDIRMRSSIIREDTISPKGQMAFMIVFKWKQSDSAKATVMAVSAEKISP